MSCVSMERVRRLAKQLEVFAPAPCAYRTGREGVMANIRVMQVPDEKAFLARMETAVGKMKAYSGGPKPVGLVIYKMDTGNYLMLAGFATDMDRAKWNAEGLPKIQAELGAPAGTLTNMALAEMAGTVGYNADTNPGAAGIKVGSRVSFTQIRFKSPELMAKFMATVGLKTQEGMAEQYKKLGVERTNMMIASPSTAGIMNVFTGDESAYNKGRAELVSEAQAKMTSGGVNMMEHVDSMGEPIYGTIVAVHNLA